MDDFPIKSKDIVLQSLFPKRLVIALGEHVEFYVDAKNVLKMLNLMRQARHEKEDLTAGKLRVEYTEDTDNDHDLWCAIHFGDFTLQRLSSNEFDLFEEGFSEFFRWAASYQMPISEPFMHRIK